MDHGAPRRLADSVHIPLGEDYGESRSAVACRRDPLADGGDQDAIEVASATARARGVRSPR